MKYGTSTVYFYHDPSEQSGGGEKGDRRGALVWFLWCIHDLTVLL